MRLDHLLSREKCEGEEPEHDPRSRVERVERFSELTRKRRKADRRGEEPKKKMPATSQTVLGVFLHCIALKVRQSKAKLQKLFAVEAADGARTLKTAQGKRAKQTLRRGAV